jgi:uncharacterized protein
MVAPERRDGILDVRPRVLIEAQPDSGLTARLLSLTVTETTEGLSRCEACFVNWGAPSATETGFLFFDRATLDFGKRVGIELDGRSVFEGVVTGLEARFPEGEAPQLTVLAEDRLQELRMTRRTRTFADLTDAEIIEQVAGQHGLSPSIDLQGPRHTVVAQLNQSDLAFLRDRARTLGAEIWLEGTTLHAATRDRRGGQALGLAYGRDLLEFKVLADLAGQATSVIVSGWDVGAKQSLNAEADDSEIQGELAGGESGAATLRRAMGERRQIIAHAVPLSTDEAEARARAAFRMIARRFVVGQGVSCGDGRLRAGSRVDLTGLGPLFSGTYSLVEVTHRFDAEEGLRTEFSAERAGLGGATR